MTTQRQDSAVRRRSSDALAGRFAMAGVDGWLHAVDLATGFEIGHQPDEPVVLASVFKIPVLVELFRQQSAGQLDGSELVTIGADDRTLGPFGISIMRDAITISWRDLAWLMIGISDNTATDVICDRVGIDNVNGLIRSLGLAQTQLVGACRDLFATIAEDLGVQALTRIDISDASVIDGLRAMSPNTTSRSTAREMTSLLGAIWADRPAPAAACSEVRRLLGLQVWPHRLASGFPEDGIRVSGKTGTLARWRNEVGVVEFPDGRRYAVAVFTRSHALTEKNAAADAVIGSAARAAIEELQQGA